MREAFAEVRENGSEAREARSEAREARSEAREARSEAREARSEAREARSEAREPGSEAREGRAKARTTEPGPLTGRTHASQTHFEPIVDAVRATLGTDVAAFLRELEKPFLFDPARRGASFELPCNLANRLGTADQVWGPGALGVRYVSIRDFLQSLAKAGRPGLPGR